MDNPDKAFQPKLSPQQEAAVKMLTSGCSVRYTALVLRIKVAKISGWIARDAAFQARLKETEPSNPAEELEEAEEVTDPVGE